MVDWVSFGLSLTAIIISSTTALVGLIITWFNLRKTFDPILAIDRERNLETDQFQVCIKNIGRGTAYLVEIMLFIYKSRDDEFEPFTTNKIDLITPTEKKYIERDLFYNVKTLIISEDIEQFSIKDTTFDESLKMIPLFIRLVYRNENRRKIQTYFYTYNFEEFFLSDKKGFRRGLMKRLV